jgi:hypothetical protein
MYNVKQLGRIMDGWTDRPPRPFELRREAAKKKNPFSVIVSTTAGFKENVYRG